jgi:hypothetical protein
MSENILAHVVLHTQKTHCPLQVNLSPCCQQQLVLPNSFKDVLISEIFTPDFTFLGAAQFKGIMSSKYMKNI